MGTKADPRRRTIFYQYRADRARRALRGIDQQIVKAEKAVAGQTPVKRNRFIQLSGGTKSVNRGLETKAMGAYNQLWQIEKSFRMSNPTQWRHQKRQPWPGDQSACPGRVEGLRHQPGSADRRIRDGRLSPAVADREKLPHV